MAKIVIVDDNENIREELKRFLCNAGYEAIYLEDFKDAVNDILNMRPDMILLDINLPGSNGMMICDEIRKQSDVPIIFVTANNTSMDELNCIMRGGDDYVTKPYQLPILMARIAAVLKRTKKAQQTNSHTIEYNGVTLDMPTATLSKGPNKAELTKNELKILNYLFEHSGIIVERTKLIDYLWDNEVFIDDNTLSVNITRIRGKLEDIGAKDFIETKRGMGYKI